MVPPTDTGITLFILSPVPYTFQSLKHICFELFFLQISKGFCISILNLIQQAIHYLLQGLLNQEFCADGRVL